MAHGLNLHKMRFTIFPAVVIFFSKSTNNVLLIIAMLSAPALICLLLNAIFPLVISQPTTYIVFCNS